MNLSLDYPVECLGTGSEFQSGLIKCDPAPFDPCRNKCLEDYSSYQFDFLVSPAPSLIIYRYIYPTVAIVTVLTNILVVLVLSKKHMRSPTNMILLAMAVADLLVALVPFPFIFLYVVLGNFQDKSSLQSSWCYMAVHGTDTFPPFCHNMAIWLTVLLAAQRCVYILKPLKAKSLCSVRNVVLACFIIVLVSLIFTLPKFLDVSELRVHRFKLLDPDDPQKVTLDYNECIMKYSAVVRAVGEDLYFSFYYWSRACLFVLIPSALLVILSCMLINGLRSANERKVRLMRENRRREALRQRESNNTTTMLVFIVLIFLIVNLPQGTVLAVFCLSQIGQFSINHELVSLVSNIDNVLILATYPINFAIYCSMSTQFRQTFKQMLQEALSCLHIHPPPTFLNNGEASNLINTGNPARQNSYFASAQDDTRQSFDYASTSQRLMSNPFPGALVGSFTKCGGVGIAEKDWGENQRRVLSVCEVSATPSDTTQTECLELRERDHDVHEHMQRVPVGPSRHCLCMVAVGVELNRSKKRYCNSNQTGSTYLSPCDYTGLVNSHISTTPTSVPTESPRSCNILYNL